MTKGNRKGYSCPVCKGKMIMEACGCMTCETCCRVDAAKCAAFAVTVTVTERKP